MSTDSPLLQGFPPLAGHSAKILILGSMPGEESLRQQQYYAHTRNSFWPIMSALYNLPLEASYAERVAILTGQGIAVWDVLQACRRSGSLDTAIERDSLVANDFARFFRSRREISRICFNGGTAARLWRMHVIAHLPQCVAAISTVLLPSTSPAHAAVSREQKLKLWREALER